MNMKKFFEVALGTGLFILDQSDRARKSVGARVGDQVDGLRDVAHDGYRAAAERIGRVADTICGHDDRRAVWNVVRFVFGLEVGIGVGLLVAPANGEETRTKVAEKAQEFADNVRQRLASSVLRATPTGD
jgi:hypothetical protein